MPVFFSFAHLLSLYTLSACLPSYPEKSTEYPENPTHDFDGDGQTEDDGDCDDQDILVFKGADELCDGKDNDCDGLLDDTPVDATAYYLDGDNDGVGQVIFTVMECSAPFGYIAVVKDENGENIDDCDDDDRFINPLAAEFCDGKDNDCDGEIDDADPDLVGDAYWYADSDRDFFPNPALRQMGCTQPAGYIQGDENLSPSMSDCDDTDPTTNPSATEVCDGVDNDCDGLIDDADTDGLMDHHWTIDSDLDGFGDATVGAVTVASCVPVQGYARLATDCDDNDASISPNAQEICDGIDQNCSGVVDEGVQISWYVDVDGDGHGANPQVMAGIEACADANPVGYVLQSDDCDDTNSTVYLHAPEYCDGVDNNCNGINDENPAVDATIWYLDADQDGHGDAAYQVHSCQQPAGYVSQGGDCDDSRDNVSPDAIEDCLTGYDDDCNGNTNDSNALHCSLLYKDADQDGYGDAQDSDCLCAPDSISQYTAIDNSDCDDSKNAVNPGVLLENCATVYDDNCNQELNEIGSANCSNHYYDYDGDSFPLEDHLCLCSSLFEYVVVFANQQEENARELDCDDDNFFIHPDAQEICDELDVDENCSGVADDAEAIGAVEWYRDADGDNYGSNLTTIVQCDQPTGYLSQDGDCNDTNPAINPGEIEICVLDPVTNLHRDEDCSGSDNDPDPALYNGGNLYYLDVDNDGYGLTADTHYGCYIEGDYTAGVGGDCDDSDSVVHPGGTEVCATSDDEDCDGQFDENGAADCHTYYYDADNDGYGIASSTICACAPNGNHRASIGADCDDNDALRNSGLGNCGLMGNIPESDAAYSIPSTGIDSIFAIEGPYFTGSNFFDYNNDGIPDLAVTKGSADPFIGGYQVTNAGAVYIHLGPFDGDLSSSSADVTVVSNMASDALQVGWVGNMDNDPADEVLVYGTYSGYRIIQNALEGAGQVDITHPLVNNTVTWSGGSSISSYSPIGDINNDGLLDFTNPFDYDYFNIRFGLDNNLDDILDGVSLEILIGGNGTSPTFPTIYDLNGDGNNETIISYYNQKLFYIQEYAPNYSKIVESVITDTTALSYDRNSQRVSKMIPGDFTGDGKTDLFYRFYNGEYNYYDQYLGVISNSGFGCLYEGSSTSTQVIFPADASNHTWCVRGDASSSIGRYGITALDLNGDSIQDLALVDNNSDDIFIYYGPLTAPLDANGNARVATLADADARIMTSADNGTLTTLGDINQDGYEDLLFRNGSAGSWKIFLGAPN